MIHKSHEIEEFTDIRAPAGTPRFYLVKRCVNCEEEHISHPAGEFGGELECPCSHEAENEIVDEIVRTGGME